MALVTRPALPQNQRMRKYTITYYPAQGRPPEEIEADGFKDGGEKGEWIEFYEVRQGSQVPLLRVRAGVVERVEAAK